MNKNPNPYARAGQDDPYVVIGKLRGEIDELRAHIATLEARPAVAVVQPSGIFEGNTIIQYEGVELEFGAELFLAAGAAPAKGAPHVHRI